MINKRESRWRGRHPPVRAETVSQLTATVTQLYRNFIATQS